MNTTTTTRYTLASGSLYLPYCDQHLTIRDNGGDSLEVQGVPIKAISDAVLDNISSRRWCCDADKPQNLAFALRVKENAERLIEALQPETVAAVAGGGSDA